MPAPTQNVSEAESKHKQDDWKDRPPSAALVEQRLHDHIERMVAVCKRDGPTFFDFEQALIPLVFTLGRLAVTLFLTCREERLGSPVRELRGAGLYLRGEKRPRLLGTFFGKVRFWRRHMRGVGCGGYYPLDLALRLPEDGFSTLLVCLMTRIATKVSYAQTRLVLCSFLGWSPSTASIEQAVLGLGRYTAEWFEQAPAPKGDGEVLIIQVDSKCPPTATEAELAKRRGKRREPLVSHSPRHRGRARRKRRGPRLRRKPGDKSKNGRMSTVVVMYTLKRGVDREGKQVLKGPLNKRVYASFAPKRHAFAIARREANKRGFTAASGKTVQIVSDGDPDLACYVEEFFPEAVHTIDIYHVLEYLWQAGRALHKKGSKALRVWVAKQRKRLYRGQLKTILRVLRRELNSIPASGPGNKSKRKCLRVTLKYLETRAHKMNYDEVIAEDFEIGSGVVEGAVRYVVAQRFDEAGMRWIRERAEALLQLRCIEINGDWNKFLRFVHGRDEPATGGVAKRISLRASKPAPLPTLGSPHES